MRIGPLLSSLVFVAACGQCDAPVVKEFALSTDAPTRVGLLPLHEGDEPVGLIAVNEAGSVFRVALDGGVVWRADVRSEVSGRPSVAGGVVVLGTAFGEWFGLDREDGGVVWRSAGHPAPHAAWTTEGEAAFVLAADGRLYALDGQDGDKMWSAAVREPSNALAPLHPDLASGEQLVIATSPKNGLVAFVSESGKVAWRIPLAGPKGVLLEGARIYATGTDEVLAAEVKTGKVLWRKATAEPPLGPPSLARGLLFFGTAKPSLVGLRPRDGEEGFRHTPSGGVSAPVAAHRELAIFATSDAKGSLVGLRPETGEVAFRLAVDHPVRGEPFVSGDRIVVLSTDGRLSGLRIRSLAK